MLGMAHATDMLNGAWGYPNGTLEERSVIRDAHIKYTMGLLYFWATDPAAGEALHSELATVGHCTDEYGPPQTVATDPPHWPYQLYVGFLFCFARGPFRGPVSLTGRRALWGRVAPRTDALGCRVVDRCARLVGSLAISCGPSTHHRRRLRPAESG
jgi:hypothetical protein